MITAVDSHVVAPVPLLGHPLDALGPEVPLLVGSDWGTQMNTVTKKELVDRIAEQTGNKRVIVKRVVQHFLDEIIRELSVGNRLEFRDFGVFEIRERAARTAQNPKTLERVSVPSKRTVKFKVGRLMKDRLHKNEKPHAAPKATGTTQFSNIAAASGPGSG